MPPTIREATREDYKVIGALLEEVDALHREALPHIFREPEGPARPEAFLGHMIPAEEVLLLVAEQDGQIIGTVNVEIRTAPDIPIFVPRRYAVVDTLVVAHGSQRQGVGRRLMERVHTWARGKGATQVELTVWEFNREAQEFYETMGYGTANRRMWKSLD